MKKLMLLLVLLISCRGSFAQSMERPGKVEYRMNTNNKAVGSGRDIFQQLGLNLSNATPRLNVKALRMFAEIGRRHLDFYMLSSIPALDPKTEDSLLNLSNELQNLYGGLANIYLSHKWFLNKDIDTRETKGFQINLNLGYKLTNSSKNNGNENIMLHSGQFAGEARFLIPLRFNPSSDTLGGLMQLKVSGQILYTDDPNYESFLMATPTDNPSNFLFSVNGEASIHIFDEMYISGGYTFSSESAVSRIGYIKVTYSRK